MRSKGVAMADNVTSPRYVGFWMRLFAFFIDSLILTVIIGLILIAIFGRNYIQLSMQGKTFWLISARIVDANTYGPPSTGKLIGRYFAYLVSIIPIFLGFLWIAFDKRKQGWHDKLAGTVVIQDEDD
ncbi:MAG: RDD family protein [Betaproteobacteria bacterium]|nr:MAG: RDD family protein [Betaproteobacteria bacterium]